MSVDPVSGARLRGGRGRLVCLLIGILTGGVVVTLVFTTFRNPDGISMRALWRQDEDISPFVRVEEANLTPEGELCVTVVVNNPTERILVIGFRQGLPLNVLTSIAVRGLGEEAWHRVALRWHPPFARRTPFVGVDAGKQARLSVTFSIRGALIDGPGGEQLGSFLELHAEYGIEIAWSEYSYLLELDQLQIRQSDGVLVHGDTDVSPVPGPTMDLVPCDWPPRFVGVIPPTAKSGVSSTSPSRSGRSE